MNCSCGSTSVRIKTFTYIGRFVYNNSVYPLPTDCIEFLCTSCLKVWNGISSLNYLLDKCFNYLFKLLDILKNEVSLKVAVLRSQDYLINGFYFKGSFVKPLKIKKELNQKLFVLLETVLEDIYWLGINKELVLSTVNSQSTLA